jgi:O-antigen/teichoic acid export membrane protein
LNFKRAFLTYGLADAISKSIGLITSPISTRLFTMSQYGAAPLLGAVWDPLALTQYGGMDSAYPFFYARKQSDEARRTLIANASLVAYLSVLVVWLGFLLFAVSSNWLVDYASVTESELAFYVMGILPASLIYWLCYLLRFLHRADSYVKITLLGRILPVVVVLPLLPWFEQENRLLVSFAVGWVLSCLALCYALYEIRRVGHWPFRLSLFDLKLSKEMMRYGLLLVPAGAAYALMVVADRLLIGHFLGTEAVAVHVIAMSIGSLGLMMVAWFGLAFDPYLSGWIARGDQTNYLPKMQLLASSLSVFFVLLSCLAAIWSAPVIQFLYPEGYGPAALLIPLIIYSAALKVLSRLGVATAVIAQSPKYHTLLYSCALVINVVVGWWLIPVLDILGAVISTVVAEAVILASWIYLGRIRLKNLPIKWGAPMLSLSLGLGFIVASIQHSNEHHSLWMLLLMSAGIVGASLFLLHRAVGSDGLAALYKHLRD